MNRLLRALAVCVAVLALACDDGMMDPGLAPDFAAGGGLHLRDTDANAPVPADTTVQLGDVISLAVAAGNGNGPQNNRNIVWNTSNPAVVSLTSSGGTAVAVAQAIGTSTVTAKIGGNTLSVVIHVTAGPGDHYLVTASSHAVIAGESVMVTAQLQDVANNPVAEAGRVVTWSSTNGGSFSAAVSLTDANGVATTTFTTSTTAGTSHVVTATDNLGATGSTAPITTLTGPAALMVAHAGDGQSAAVGTAVAVPPAVQVTDQHGNPVQGVAVEFAVTGGGGSVTGANAVTDANGVASVGSWTLGETAGPNTLDATSPGLPTVTFTATATSGDATQLVMVTQPSATAQAGVAFAQQPSVRLQDAFGNDVAQAGVQVTATIASGGGTLLGTTSVVTDAAGVATFTDLAIGGTVGTRTLEFSAAGLTSVTSDDIDVTAGPASVIELTTPALEVAAGSTIQITGQLRDAYGNPVLQSGIAVSWSSTNGGSFAPNPTLTDAGGETTVDFTVSSAGGVEHEVTATAGAASGQITITTQNTAPVAGDDAFDAIGNVTVPVPAPGVLANDSDAESSVSAVPGVIATTNGGTVTMNADGSFTYLSAAGFEGNDTFDYTVTDGTLTDVGTVTMTVTPRVWYVDNSAVAPGDGRDASPFTTLKAAEGASAPGERIFVLYGDGTSTGYDEGIVLQDGQTLTGQGVPADVDVVLNGVTVTLLGAGSAPQLTRSTPGATIEAAQDNTVEGVDIASTAGAGVSANAFSTLVVASTSVAAAGGAALDLQNGAADVTLDALSSTGSAADGLRLIGVSGTVNAPAGTIESAAGAALRISAGSADVSFGGSIDAAASGIVVHDNSGGNIVLSGPTKVLSTAEDTAVVMTGNAGTTLSFTNGGLVITTTTGPGIVARDGGTLSVSGPGNVVTAAGGTPVSIIDTDIGAAGVTFQSISANGGSNGIVLTNTGPVAGLTVTGNGGPCNRSAPTCTGGTISGITGADGDVAGNAVHLQFTVGVSLSRMHFTGATNHAISGNGVNGFAGELLVIDGSFGTSSVLEEGAVVFDNLSGTGTLTQSYVGGGVTDNVRIRNDSFNALTLTLADDTLGLNHAATGRDGVALSASAGTLSAEISDSRFFGSRTDQFQMRLTGSASGDLQFTGNTLTNAHPATVSGSGGIVLNIGEDAADNVTATYDITGNSVQGVTGAAIAAVKGPGTANADGQIVNNTIGDASIANSGSTHGAGIFLNHAAQGSHRVRVDGNSVHQYSGAAGIHVQAGGVPAGPGINDGSLNATIVNNLVSNPGTNNPGSFVDAMFFDIGTNAGDAYTVCLNVGVGGANDISSGGRPDEGGGPFTVLSFAGSPILKMEGYPLATHVGSAAEPHIFSTLTTHNITGGGGYVETPSLTATYAGNNALGAPCNLP